MPLVVSLARALDACAIPHAFGGALALGYAAEPRATADIDLDVFLDADAPEPALKCLSDAGVILGPAATRDIQRAGQARLRFQGVHLDVFFAVHPFYASCDRRAVTVPFDGGAIRVLSAEDLVIFKALFNRPKDWVDIDQILRVNGSQFDSSYVLGWLDELVGPADSARQRLGESLA